METKVQMQGLSTKKLTGKVAVITGGARGIGAATARLFAQNGAHVVIADILDDLGMSLAESIRGRYIHFSVNVNGIVHGIKHAARAMIQGQEGGSIICTSSSAALMGGLGSHAYTSSKEAIIGLARSTACELGMHGIRVNCISPHGVPSEMLVDAYKKLLGKADMGPEDVSQIVGESGSLLKGRAGRLEDVAQAALFLASEDSGFITAHNLVMDGGYTSANSKMTFIYQKEEN